ncbi:ketoacyl-ACP synthase III [Heyndrickxia sporothermodurans]|uniref:3-oxoacyl-ACP synthase III family protein n=1 Tax=Heyndrickxia sporothermodurans TaxID=46224 RepID=UPI002E1A22BA|nr:ketoacyl-ACP synthase III [Heyndrickxia sporothermodurans]
MPNFKFDNIKITGITTAVPHQRIKVESFNEVFGEDAVQKFTSTTGIREFRKTSSEQTASDLGYVAAEELLLKKDVDKSEIGALIFISQSPDYRRPATACVLQSRLGLTQNCAAFDVNLGCSGFIYGLQTLSSMMQCSDIKKAIIIISETATKLTNPKDKATAMIFGDAGSAILLEKTQDAPSIYGNLKTDGTRYRSIILPAGGFRDMKPSDEVFMCSDGNERSLYNIFMDGTAVFSFAISDVPETIKEFLQYNNSTIDDYDSFILHQANSFIIRQISRRLKMPKEKVPISIDRYGNTGGISIPLTICDYYGKKHGGTVKTLMCGFGIGLSWGVASISIDIDNVFPIIETDDYFAEGVIKPGTL